MRSSTRVLTSTGLAILLAACSSTPKSSGETNTGDGSTTPTNDGGTSVNGSDGGGGGGGTDSGTAPGGGSDASSGINKLPFPTLTNQGIPVIATPKIVTITFNSDTNATALAAFGESLTTSSYWSTVMKDYSVGSGTGVSAAVTATLAATYTDDPNAGEPESPATTGTIPNLVATTIENNPSIPAPTADTIYVFYLPSSVTIDMNQGGQTVASCVYFGGYHASTLGLGDASSSTIYYAIVPECAPSASDPRSETLTALENLTFSASHEIAEAVTDPEVTSTALGWYNDYNDDPSDDISWTSLADGEVADFCVDQFLATNDETTEGSYTVQRIWSVSAAAAGTNPCIPVPTGEVYFNAAPKQPFDVIVVDDTTPATIEVDTWADGTVAPAGTWSLAVDDLTALSGGTAAMNVSFAGGSAFKVGSASFPSAVTVSSGQKVSLTVSLVSPSTLTVDAPFVDGVLLSLNAASGGVPTVIHYWPFAVTTTSYAASLGVDAAVTGLPQAVHNRMQPRLHRRPGTNLLKSLLAHRQ